MRRTISYIIFTLTVAASLAWGTNASAQFGVDNLKILLTPERPRGSEEVTAVASDNSNDLTRSTITWTVNGRVVKRGVGEKTVTFTTGDVGSVTTLTARIINPSGIPFEKTLRIRPADVELLYEAVNTYTPPFYRGKTLPAYEGDVRVVAVPRFISAGGARISSRNLLFTWHEGDRVRADVSGVGKDSFILKGRIPFRSVPISVEVSTTDQTIVAAGTTFVEQRQPTAALYEEHPLYGVLYNRALTAPFNLSGDEVRLTAAPFFLDGGGASSLQFRWLMNNVAVGDASEKTMVFRNTGGKGGEALVRVEVRNSSKIFQGASAETSVLFGGSN